MISMLTLTNLRNVVAEGVTIENRFGEFCHAEFMDDIYPDRTCGQHDRGILVVVNEGGAEVEYFVSFTDGSVWHNAELVIGARCPEVCVQVAVEDALETYWYERAEDGSLVMP